MKVLNFKWSLREDVDSIDEITGERIETQRNKLNEMLDNLKEKLALLNGITVINNCLDECSGKYEIKDLNIVNYIVSNSMTIVIMKQGRKTTWNDVYKTVNSIKSAKYNLVQNILRSGGFKVIRVIKLVDGTLGQVITGKYDKTKGIK